MADFAESLDRSATAAFERVVVHLPELFEALVLLLIGWLLARLLRAATRRGISLLDSLIARKTTRERWRIGRSASVLGTVVYWVVLLFFVTAATQSLGLHTFTDWLARLLDHLPALAAGVLIMAAGYVLSGLVAELVQVAATGLAPPQRKALARLAQGATLVVTVLVGADQIGLRITWIAIFAAVLVASVMSGVTIAVSLGARAYVGNLIGAYHLRQALRVGQFVRVAGHEGRIVDVTATSLVLESADGRVMLPGGVYHDQAIVLVANPDRG